jgi:hypothetical protein
MTTRRNNYCLSVSFATSGTVAVGNPVEIVDDLTIAVPDAAGSKAIIGNVFNVADGVAVVDTKFREMRTDRLAGPSGCAVGPFVFDDGGVVIAYDGTISIGTVSISGSAAFSATGPITGSATVGGTGGVTGTAAVSATGPISGTASATGPLSLSSTGPISGTAATGGEVTGTAEVSGETGISLSGSVEGSADVSGDGTIEGIATFTGLTGPITGEAQITGTADFDDDTFSAVISQVHDPAAIMGMVIVGATGAGYVTTLEY